MYFWQGRVAESKQYEVQAIDEHQTEVRNQTSYNVVNLTERTCSCKRFDLDKIPCVHALAAAESASLQIVSLTNAFYHTSYLYNAYSKCVKPRDASTPVPDAVGKKVCKPPAIRKQAGRPKKSRIKSVLEVVAASKRPRKTYSCRNCSKGGHNTRTCPVQNS